MRSFCCLVIEPGRGDSGGETVTLSKRDRCARGMCCRHYIKDVMFPLCAASRSVMGYGGQRCSATISLSYQLRVGRRPSSKAPAARRTTASSTSRAAIDNDNTRRAYGRALGLLFAFLEDGGKERLQDIGPLAVRAYLEGAKANGLSPATLKQHMASIRMLFDHLVTGGVLEHNPALSVKAPRQKLSKGKTRVLTTEEAGDLLRSVE